MTLNKPYFMSDKKWYFFDTKNFCYKLTNNAPIDAINSYNDFYNKLKKMEVINNGKSCY